VSISCEASADFAEPFHHDQHMTRHVESFTTAWVVIAIGIVATVAGWFILRQPDRLALDAEAWTFCEQGYRHARTAADSQMVDVRRPVLSRMHSTVALTCGAMRIAWRRTDRSAPDARR
jgi:hypothetical protein